MPNALTSLFLFGRSASVRRRLVFLVFALVLPTAELAYADDDAPPLKDGYAVHGANVVEERLLRTVIGKRPKAVERLTPWSQGVIRKLERHYRRQGFNLVRVHFGMSDENEPTFDIDEGVLHGIVFHGISFFDSTRYRVVLDLPSNVFHAPTLTLGLHALEEKYGFKAGGWRVEEADDGTLNSVGALVPTRYLHIHPAEGEESFGFRFGARVDATYGLLPQFALKLKDPFWTDDRLSMVLGVGVPYRRYIFDADPKFQWVHGRFDLGYRFPTFAADLLAPTVDTSVAFSDDARPEFSSSAYYVIRTDGFANLAIFPTQETVVTLGLGVRYHEFFDLTPVESPDPDAVTKHLRYGFRATAEHVFSPEVARRDLRSRVSGSAFFATDDHPNFFMDLRFAGLWVSRVGHYDFIVRGEAIYLEGDVTLVDEGQLSSESQRVTFGGRYWVRAAGSLELAVRFPIYRDRVKFGLWNDFSVFGDRSAGGNLAAIVDSVGPSLHLLLFDELGFDLYYGFGFSGEDFATFDHNISFSLVTVY
ncbi:MAG: hypothetical protein IV100_02405 [Myxococcales bacterium]|nr:hypothetical protein [Myxococcales bacterium]